MLEITKRCTNCGYYPFCKRIEKRTSYCDKWQKGERELKLEYKDGENYVFQNI